MCPTTSITVDLGHGKYERRRIASVAWHRGSGWFLMQPKSSSKSPAGTGSTLEQYFMKLWFTGWK